VFRDKLNGLIVDYVGVFRDLQKALAIYGSASGGGIKEGETPIKGKGALVEQLKRAIAEAATFCVERGVDLEKLQAAKGFERVKLLDDALEALLVNDESKTKYLSLAGSVQNLYKAILPDPMASEFGPTRTLFVVIADKIRSLTPETDISQVMEAVEVLLDESIATEGYVIQDSVQPHLKRLVDLSKIDFEALKTQFEKGRKRTEAEKLKTAIGGQDVQIIVFVHIRQAEIRRNGPHGVIDLRVKGAVSLSSQEGHRIPIAVTRVGRHQVKSAVAIDVANGDAACIQFDIIRSTGKLSRPLTE
jgi:type I restriction enzyme R subunit